jgi:hypothetical protein
VVGAISLVRFGLVPVATLAAVTACAQFLPADNVCILALLIQVRPLGIDPILMKTATSPSGSYLEGRYLLLLLPRA